MKFNKEFVLWPITPFGAKPDEGGSDAENGDDVSNNANPPANQQDSGKGNSKNKQNESESSAEDDDPYAGLSAKELRRLLADTDSKANQSEKDRKALQDKLDEHERAKLSEDQKNKLDLDKEREANSVLRATNARLSITQAILLDKRFDWHNPEIVAQQLNPEIVKVDDNGKVSGIEKELARVAKDHDYLLVKKRQQQQNNDSNNNGPTGFQPGQGGANQGGSLPPNAKELVKNYPALANRGL
jgi:hypothetical protein